MASIKELALLSHAVYDDPKDRVNLDGWLLYGDIIKISNSFQAAVYKSVWGGERVIAYCGSDDIEDWGRDNTNILDRVVPPQAYYAMKLFEMTAATSQPITQDDFNKCKIEFIGDCYNKSDQTLSFDIMTTGHSLGGALASIVANKYDGRVVTFNSPGILGLTNHINLKKHENRELYDLLNLVETQGEKATREQITTDQNHMLDAILLLKKQKSIEIRESDLASKNACHYHTEDDQAFRTGTHIGRSYEVGTVPGIANILINVHTIAQFTKVERYDENGNIDPDIKENITINKKAFDKFETGYQWKDP